MVCKVKQEKKLPEVMHDCVGNEIRIGDCVLFSNNEGCALCIGEILTFTHKRAGVRFFYTGDKFCGIEYATKNTANFFGVDIDFEQAFKSQC